MLAPNPAELIVLIGTVGVIVALLVYLYQRLVKWAPRQDKSLEHVRKHALWTGVIAWALSSLSGGNRAGLLPAGQVIDPANPSATIPADPWATIPFMALFGPIAAVLLVHLVGQLTWPAPKSPKRVAVLEFRRVRAFMEPALAWTVLGVFALSAGTLIWLAFAPGFPALPARTTTDGSSFATPDGRVPGWVLATALGAALITLALGTYGVMRLIASRRSLENLSHEQNSTLRVIGMNRLLRVSATVASGLGAIAGNFLFQPSPESPTNWLVLANIAVLFAMLWWRPPALKATSDPYDSRTPQGNPALRLADSGAAAVVPAAVVGVLAGALLTTWFGWLGPALTGIIFVLLTYGGLEVLLRRNYATPGRSRNRLDDALPWPLYAALAIAASGLVLAINLALRAATAGLGGSEGWYGQGGPTSLILVPASCALAVAAAGSLAAWPVLRRPGLNQATPRMDADLRRRSLFRIARTVAAGWFAILGALLLDVPWETDPNPLAVQLNMPAIGGISIALAALLLIYPVRRLAPADYAQHDAPAGSGTSGAAR
ncbi:hypothetical protein AL755_18950 [Arthrobacter sp. ERGS1:01]|uniref:hypothetical protein n=1 Tax=Arthrobacter sp. ERGS1:01 TaxID=1704044 RepID=UPI0006B66A60|nr:hypothetical protein [Arthrobacter sp. ERGS1:01]ALE07060.1 hypothetical protein AL755_18950 [Arthrobacter sp. ERGS1:01]